MAKSRCRIPLSEQKIGKRYVGEGNPRLEEQYWKFSRREEEKEDKGEYYRFSGLCGATLLLTPFTFSSPSPNFDTFFFPLPSLHCLICMGYFSKECLCAFGSLMSAGTPCVKGYYPFLKRPFCFLIIKVWLPVFSSHWVHLYPLE